MSLESTLTPRARARVETIEQIKQIARHHLAVEGPNLSLRAVARDLGVVSSAVYRYFASRDELLTALIVDAYTSMADAIEQAEKQVPRRDLAGRWFALGRSARQWALHNQHEYALLYGSPVPGYAAPQDTIEPANRPVLLAMAILREGVERRAIDPPRDRLPKPVRADFERIASIDGFTGVPPGVMARAFTAWAQLFGTISFELFGRFTNAITDYDAYFEHQLKVTARHLGLSR
ncbi:MAG TPA: TetR/AcrR family transcriptional regulator [Jatrophihabitans sp.]|nr:TetR/AcrR family transcriptional regulator [Jatrophihabitans sp.]